MSAFWRDPAGFTLGNESKTALVAPPDMARFRTTGQKLQISFSGQPYKDLAIVAADIPIDGAFPDGTGQELQARGSATTFKRLTHSGASGANLNLGGLLTIDAAEIKDRSIVLSAIATVPETSIKLTQYHTSPQPILMQFDRARGLVTGANPIQDNDVLGEIKFRGYRDGAFQNYGYLRTAWNLNDGGYIEVGSGSSPTPGVLGTTGARLTVTQNVGVGISGTNGYYAVVVDNTANVVTGVGSMATTATAGFLWVPQALGVLTAAPNPNKFGWKPLAFVGSDLYTFDGTRWRNIVSAQFTGEWRWSDLVSGPVGDGYLRIGASTFAAATDLVINNQTNDNIDVSFVLDQMVPGDQIYFQEKDDATHWARYELTSVGVLVDDDYGFMVTALGSNGTIANNQAVTVRLISGGGGGGAGGTTDPGGVATEVQYKQNATTFGGIGYSSVSGANVRFGGSLASDNATPTVAASKAFIINPTGTDLGVVLGESSTTTNPILMQIQRSRGVGGAPEAVIKGDWVGKISFEGWQGSGAGSGLVPMGYLHSRWDGADALDFGNIVVLGAGGDGEARVAVQQKAGAGSVAAFAGTHWFQVQTAGFAISAGAAGALFHKVDGTYLGVLEINATGTPPVDLGKVLTVTDIGSGVLMPRWQPPSAVALRLDQIQDPTASRAFNMGLNTLSFSYTAAAANEDNFLIQSGVDASGTGCVFVVRAQGAASEKAPMRVEAKNQLVFAIDKAGGVGVRSFDHGYSFNVAGTSRFVGGVRNEQVAAESLVVVKQSAGVDAPALLQFSRAGVALADLASDDIAGRIEFYGKIAGSYPLLGYLSALHNITLGGVITLGAGTGAGTQARLQVTQGTTAGSVEMRAGSYYIQVNTAGIAMVGGTTGSIYYKGDPTYLHVLDINPATDSGKVLTVAEDAVGSGIWYPRWKTLTATGAFPDGSGTELQARNSGPSFKPVLNSSTSGSDVILGGMFTVNAGGSGNQDITLSALTSNVAYLAFNQYRDVDKLPVVIQFVRGRGIAGAPVALESDDQIGDIRFYGHLPTVGLTQVAGIRGLWNSSLGGRLDMAAGNVRMTVMATFGAQMAEGISGNTFTVASTGFTFSHGTRGALYWKNENGFFVALPVGAIGQVLTAVEVGGAGSGIREPQWTSMAASGAFPVGGGSELQARNSDFTFKKVDGSAVSGRDITLGGELLVSDTAGHSLVFERTVDVANTETVGAVWFRRAGAPPTYYGFLRAYRNDDQGGFNVQLSRDLAGSKHLIINDLAATLAFDGKYITIQSTGIQITVGGANSLLYQTGSSIQGLAPSLTAGWFLKSNGGLPLWAAVTIDDVGGVGGILPIAKGGTGLGTPPTIDGQLLRANATFTGYAPATLVGTGTVSISNVAGTITIVGTGGSTTPPQGSATELQYRKADGTQFQPVTSSSVSGADITLGGYINLTSAGTQRGYIRSYFDGTPTTGEGDAVEMVASDGSHVRVTSLKGVKMYESFNGLYFAVGHGGFFFSQGGPGMLWHTNSDGFFYPLANGGLGKFLKSVGPSPNYPSWVDLDTADIKTGILGTAFGGTGSNVPPLSGQLLIGALGSQYTTAYLTQGQNIGISNNSGQIIIGFSGLLPVTLGGTGANTTALVGQILRASTTTTYAPVTLAGSAGIGVEYVGGTITFTNLQPGGAATLPGGSSGTPLQYRKSDGTAFEAVALSGVTAAGWVGIGTATPAVRFNVVGDTVLQSATGGFIFQVQSAGFLFNSGAFGSLYYRDYYGYFVPTLENPSSTAKIPFWDSTYVTGHPANGALRWLTLGTNLSITGTTLNATGTGSATPGGSAPQLQYHKTGGTFEGVTSSRAGTAVNPANPNAADVAFGGGIYLDDAGSDASQEFVISATSLGPTRMVLRSYKNDTVVGSYIQFERGRGTQSVWSTLTGGEVIAEFRFVGQLGSYPTTTPTSLGTIQSFYSLTFGGVMRVMARTALATSTPASFVELTDNGAGTVNATLQAGTHYIQMQAGGIRLSVGDTTTGGLLYQTGSQSIAAEPLPSAATDPGEVYVLRHNGTKPYWGVSPGGTGSTPPAGNGSQLQYRDAGAFGAVATSGVTAAGWVGIGITTPSVRFHVVGDTQLQSSSFIFQVQSAGFYFNTGAFGSLYYRDYYGYFIPSGTPGTGTDKIAFWDADASVGAPVAGAMGWLTLGTNLSIAGTTLNATSGGGGLVYGTSSTNQLLYHQSSTQVGGLANSVIDASGNLTLGGGVLTLQSITAGAKVNLKASTNTEGPTIYTERSLGTLSSKSGMTAGFSLLTVDCRGYDNTLTVRNGMALDVIAQATWTNTSAPTGIRVRTTPVNSLTPAGRMILGASKVLTRDTLTELFRITYTNTAEHSGMAGEIHLVWIVKGFHNITHTGVYRRKIKFVMFHNAANNTAAFRALEETGAREGVETASPYGVTVQKIKHAVNNIQAYPGIDTDQPLSNTGDGALGNEIIYKTLFETNMSTIYSIVCYYNIFYSGENELAMASSI